MKSQNLFYEFDVIHVQQDRHLNYGRMHLLERLILKAHTPFVK